MILETQPITLGHVRALYRYPVKSMRGESLAHARLRWHGLEGDRRYAFLRGNYEGSFPWLTGREVAEMLRYQPYCVDEERPADSAVRVRTPVGDDLPVESDELRTRLAVSYDGPVDLLHLGRGAHDDSPLSLLTTATITTLGRASEHTLEARRFRANVVIEPLADGDFPEDAWIGGQLVFGGRDDSARVHVQQRIVRCVMITLDPETTARAPAVLKAAGRIHETCAGVHALPITPGTLAVGDAVTFFPATGRP